MVSQVNEVESGRHRSMSAEDEMMFKLGRPFEDSKATNTPKSTPPASPSKKIGSPEKEVLRPISMPEPFKI
eukprot:CAMPEP_0172307642 /NCGR_PEP_ID=MMETSP1058-20130122/8457_1 /TAXON_ID=83371 /ORGANISM="Detonula confervacea, Strain CCMP 353" /LENGTH=70 /DNA_ID=CAMNT_0013019865 /DNA_START=132 /DNA_END=344 /DNA_ORIENTATION=+